MAGTVTTNLTMISSCDTTTSGGTWSTGTVDSDAKVEGAACLYVKYTSVGTKTVTFTPTAALSLASTCVRFWVSWASKAMPDTKANGGLKLKFESSASDWAEWNVAGKDTLPHNGWICHVVKTDTTPTSSGGSINWSAINKLTMTFTLLVKGNVSWDVFRYGTTMTIKAGTSGDPAKLDDMVTEDVNNAYGFISFSDGVYFLQGLFVIGDSVGTTSTYFKDTSKILSFINKDVGSAYWEIKLVGNSTGTTKVYFGDPTSEVAGCVIKSAETAKYKITATDTNITEFGFYGCSFIDAATIEGQTYSSVKKFKNSSFTNCSEFLPYTGIVDACNFISSAGRSIRISSSSHNTKNCQFINCQTAIHHNVGGPIDNHYVYTYDNLKFSGNTYDIENSATSPNYYIDIDRLNGSNPDSGKINNSGGGSTTINPLSVTLKITVKNTANQAIENAQCAIYKTSDDSQLMNEDTLSTGVAEEPFQYLANTDIYWRVRKSSIGDTRYVPVGGTGVIESGGFSIAVTLYQEALV